MTRVTVMRSVFGVIAIQMCTLLLLAGCERGQKPPKLGVAAWKPQSVNGPTEIRDLPKAEIVMSAYEHWLRSEATSKARVYKKVLQGANQLDFQVDVVNGETPVGRAEYTFLSFIYADPTNGQYQLEWKVRGEHSGSFLKLGARALEVWLQPFGVAEDGKTPRLQIVAIEGVEPVHALVAVPGKSDR